jgi:hypothetical protein
MKLKSAEDMAKKLGITEETFLEWRKLGMPWVKIGKSIYILEDSFIRWAREREVSLRPGAASGPEGQNAQDAPGQDFFGKPIGEVIPLKKAGKSRGD